MIKQCKGKDLNKVPASKLEDKFMGAIKYDGHYTQIHKIGNKIRFFTSGGKEFYIKHIADELLNLFNTDIDFILEAEYIADTTGKLGNRGKAAKLTTYRTNFSKGIPNHCEEGKDIFKVFDCLECSGRYNIDTLAPFKDRLNTLKQLNLGKHLQIVDYTVPKNLSALQELAQSLVNQGYEGMYLKSPDHIYYPGKRVNDAIKLKLRPTVDLLCLDIEEGEGKYEGLIGSLVLQDRKGRIVKVGSGLTDIDRNQSKDYYVGKVIEVEYEQILDTYIQPTFIGIREDKTREEID